MAVIVDGKTAAKKVTDELLVEASELKRRGIIPGLAVIIVGDDAASKIYVKNKESACAKLGIYSEKHELAAGVSENELINLVRWLNVDPKIHGILVQLPLPAHISENAVINSVAPEKDVDAFCRENVGRITLGDFKFAPCTPSGVMRLLDDYGIEISGKNCVVVGRSNIVGKPMAALLLKRDATVTICHSKTRNLAEFTHAADILISAVGIPNFIKKDMIKPGAAVIDVGINRLPGGKITGDVDFEEAAQTAGFITPVPGGVGPMTIAMLMKNTVLAAKN